MTRRYLVPKIVAIAALALVVSVVIVSAKLTRDRREAKQLIMDAGRLEQTEETSNLSNFLAKHRRFVHPTGDCSEDQCAYVAYLTNAPLSFFRLAPPGEFNILVLAKQGQVEEIYVSAKTVISGQLYAATIRSVSAAGYKGGTKSFSSDASAEASGRLRTSTIELGPEATSDDRRIAFQISVDCMFEVNGCSDLTKITGGWPIRVEN